MTTDPTRQEVTMPFLNRKVPVQVDFKKHPAIQTLAKWGPQLQHQIEQACFANYQAKLASIGPESLPKIRQPSHVWKHLTIESIRIDPAVMDRVVVYVVPGWDESEHMEWCIEGGKK